MRLTERKVCYPECDKQGNLTKVDYIEIKDKKLAEQKLCQLEDIEEELGIDLATLFKALKNGVYDKTENRNVPVSLIWHDYLKELVLFYDDSNLYYNGCYQFKDYGKTWALTKEELE